MTHRLLMNIAPKLRPAISYAVLNRLSNRTNIDFPEVKKVIGRHKFYDEDEVTKWYGYWAEIAEGHRQGYKKRRRGD